MLYPLEPIEVWHHREFYETKFTLERVATGVRGFWAETAGLKLDLHQMREILAVAAEVLDEET